MKNKQWTRRNLIAATAGLSALPRIGFSKETTMVRKFIPSSGEKLPVIGLGTYNVFDVESSAEEISQKREIVELLIKSGGSVIDTSPMYNRSERILGELVNAGTDRGELFIATKVWINGTAKGLKQMQRSAELMRTDVIDLMQVHNLRDTQLHMATINQLKDAGRVRYSGLTHYTARSHRTLEKEMRQYKPDFIQINYSLAEPEADERLLPLAGDLGIAVLINRPFQSGRLFRAVAGKDLPDWAQPFAASWGQFFLKFIVSHPAVTSAIPATSKAHHMIDNLAAGQGRLPDAAMRQRMANYFKRL